MLNYIIATYNGNKVEYTLENQLQILYTIVMSNELKYLSQITVVCPPTKSKDKPFEYYYQKEKWNKLFKPTKVKLEYMDYVGDNNNASYDQWIQAYQKYPDFKYYIFMEDDYYIHSSLTNFDEILVDYYNEKVKDNMNIGYVCSFASKLHGFAHHAAISTGIINKNTLELLGDDVLQDFYKLAKNTHCQIAFSKLFTDIGIDIFSMHDDFYAWFWCSGKRKLINYSTENANKFMFVPFQYLLSYYFLRTNDTTNTTSHSFRFMAKTKSLYSSSKYR